MNSRIPFFSLLALLAIGFLAGCGRQTPADAAPSPKLTTVRFGVSPFQDTLLPILGSDSYKGWYREEGLDVKFQILGWEEVQEALAAGAVDVAINNCSSIVATHAKRPDLVYYFGVNTFDNGFALMVRPDSGLRSVDQLMAEHPSRDAAIAAAARQLRGKTVITTASTDMEQGVAAFARRGGLRFSRNPDSEVKIINLPPDEGLAAFLAGEGDAYIGGIPQRTRAGKAGMKELVSGLDLGPAPINGFVTTKKYAQEHGDELLRLLHVWFRIVNFVESNQDEAGTIVASIINRSSGSGFTADDFKRFWQKYERYPLSADAARAEILESTGRNYWKRRWDDCNEYFHDIVRVIPARVNPDDVFWMPQAFEAYARKYPEKR